MKVLLLHPERDFVPAQLPAWQERELTQDLALETLWRAMSGDDAFLRAVSRTVLLSAMENDIGTMQYRQAVLQDCLNNAQVVWQLYALAVEALERKRQRYFGFLGRYPSGVLSGSVDLLKAFVDILRRMRGIAEQQAASFASAGFTALFAMLRRELSEQYLTEVEDHLAALEFKHGVLLSARLGKANAGADYVLRQRRDNGSTWLDRVLGRGPPAFTIRIHDRDDAGFRALSEIRDRGLNLVANAAAQSSDHIAGFFETLRVELGFYAACLNLSDKLAAIGAPTVLPRPEPAGSRRLAFVGLHDVCLTVQVERRVTGNEVNADGKNVLVVTGANQGGKSTFLRSVGLAQLMMQAGMFVGAESYTGESCSGIFTHYKREEDPTMRQGKLDEELGRLSDIVGAIRQNGIVLFNESFAATNEREGSEIARQVVSALVERGIKVVIVTHLYDFAHRFFDERPNEALFLRAEREADGTRTFKLRIGEPLETSFGQDVYNLVFGPEVSANSL